MLALKISKKIIKLYERLAGDCFRKKQKFSDKAGFSIEDPRSG